MLIVYGLVIAMIAYFSSRATKKLSDYVLGGRKLSAAVTALGAGASDMSSWLLMALPGFVYVSGLNVIWMPVALVLGAYANWLIVAKRLRIYTEVANDSLTLAAYLGNRFDDQTSKLRLVTSIAILIFFTFYSVAGFVSGALLLEHTFNISYHTALLVMGGVIVSYTAVGGFLAVNRVDFFQGMLMFFALLVVPITAFNALDGMHNALISLRELSVDHLNIFYDVKLLSVISLFAWGLGYFGQPHINVRFMAVKSVKELPIARMICMTWMFISLVGAILTGLVGYLFYIDAPLNEPETVFIALSQDLFNPWMSGILLSAVLSAIMSTVSAQILMSASILVEDIYHGLLAKQASETKFVLLSRISLVLVSALAIILAMDPERTILQSVAFAWSGLGASFGPVTILSLYWRRMNLAGAIAGIITGMLMVILWEWMATLNVWIFASQDLLPGFVILPGFLSSTCAIIIVSLLSDPPGNNIVDKYDLVGRSL